MLDDIRNAIKEQYIPDNQSYLIEKDTHGRKGQMECRICSTKDEEILLCRFDQGGDNCKLFPYFNEEHGLVSMCDYILFVEDDKSLFVFLIELKDSAHSPQKQTTIAQTFAEFLVKRIETINDKYSIIKPVSYRKVGIKSRRSKITTKGHANLTYNKNNYVVLPDCHKFYIKQMKELPMDTAL